VPSAQDFSSAAKRQASYLLDTATKFKLSDGREAISHRDDHSELWGDFVYMVPPFLAYYGVSEQSVEMLQAAVEQCQLYRDVLVTKTRNSDRTRCEGLWRHIVSEADDLPEGACCTDPHVWLSR
jgi:rhamnogalacturonyl hydrolase YesR